MPTRIRIPQRIVERGRIAIEALRIARLWHNRVHRQEMPQNESTSQRKMFIHLY